MQKDDKLNLITGGFMLLFGISLFVLAGQVESKHLSGDIGSGFLPTLISILIIFLSIILLVRTFWHLRKQVVVSNNEASTDNELNYKAVALSFANLVLYVLLLKPVGFILSSVLFMAFQMALMSPEKSTAKRALIWGVSSAVVAVAVYFIFAFVFSMPLPAGLLK